MAKDIERVLIAVEVDMAKDIERVLSEIGGEAATSLAHLRRIYAGEAQAKTLLADVQTRLERIRNEAMWARADLEKAKLSVSEPEKD